MSRAADVERWPGGVWWGRRGSSVWCKRERECVVLVWWTAQPSAALHKHGHLLRGHRTHTSRLKLGHGASGIPLVIGTYVCVCVHYSVNTHIHILLMCSLTHMYTHTDSTYSTDGATWQAVASQRLVRCLNATFMILKMGICPN